MQFFNVLLLYICGTLASKETPEDYAKLLSNKLLLEIEKRLNDDSLVSNEPDHCTYALNTSTIIRTTASIDAGAKFLSPADVTTRDQCISKCCADEECDLVVFKEQEDHACYLFHCGHPGKCHFTSHAGFSSVFIKHQSAVAPALPPHTPVSRNSKTQHEEELKNLASGQQTSGKHQNADTVVSTPDPTQRPPVVTTEHIVTKIPVSVTASQKATKTPAPLFGMCNTNEDCAGSITMCLAGYCVCKEGYHEQEGVCRKDCGHIQFECKNEGHPLMFPQCIAVYDRCDGIPQCKDKSDEKHCDQELPPEPTNSADKQQQQQIQLNPAYLPNNHQHYQQTQSQSNLQNPNSDNDEYDEQRKVYEYGLEQQLQQQSSQGPVAEVTNNRNSQQHSQSPQQVPHTQNQQQQQRSQQHNGQSRFVATNIQPVLKNLPKSTDNQRPQPQPYGQKQLLPAQSEQQSNPSKVFQSETQSHPVLQPQIQANQQKPYQNQPRIQPDQQNFYQNQQNILPNQQGLYQNQAQIQANQQIQTNQHGVYQNQAQIQANQQIQTNEEGVYQNQPQGQLNQLQQIQQQVPAQQLQGQPPYFQQQPQNVNLQNVPLQQQVKGQSSLIGQNPSRIMSSETQQVNVNRGNVRDSQQQQQQQQRIQRPLGQMQSKSFSHTQSENSGSRQPFKQLSRQESPIVQEKAHQQNAYSGSQSQNLPNRQKSDLIGNSLPIYNTDEDNVRSQHRNTDLNEQGSYGYVNSKSENQRTQQQVSQQISSGQPAEENYDVKMVPKPQTSQTNRNNYVPSDSVPSQSVRAEQRVNYPASNKIHAQEQQNQDGSSSQPQSPGSHGNQHNNQVKPNWIEGGGYIRNELEDKQGVNVHNSESKTSIQRESSMNTQSGRGGTPKIKPVRQRPHHLQPASQFHEKGRTKTNMQNPISQTKTHGSLRRKDPYYYYDAEGDRKNSDNDDTYMYEYNPDQGSYHNVGKADQGTNNQDHQDTKQPDKPKPLHHGHEASMTKPLSHGSSDGHAGPDTDSEGRSGPGSDGQIKQVDHKAAEKHTDHNTKTETPKKLDKNEDTKQSSPKEQPSQPHDDKESGPPETPDNTGKVMSHSNTAASANNSQPDIQVAAGADNKWILQEEVAEDYSDMPSNQGAIVALALGLAITAVMLVWVGCRLRTVKKRLRRGRALNSNEADYLINGMYL